MYEQALHFITVLNFIPAALFAGVLLKDMFLSSNSTLREEHRKKFCVWSTPFICMYAYVILNVLLMIANIDTDKILLWKVTYTALGAWYIFEIAKVNKFDFNNIRRRN